MEQPVSKCTDCDVDLESGVAFLDSNASDEPESVGFNSCDGSLQCEARVTVTIASNYDDVSVESVKVIVDKKNTGGLEKKSVKDKPKAMSAKKPPKPPRAPRGLSLDSADQKLIRELTEIAKLKRARVERMKALMKMKEAKNSSSKNQLFGTLLTILFFVVLLFQGISSRTNSSATFQGSPMTSKATVGGVFSILQSQDLSANNA